MAITHENLSKWQECCGANKLLLGNCKEILLVLSHEANLEHTCSYFMQYGKDISTYIKQQEYVLPLTVMP